MFRKFKPHPMLKDFILFYFELDWKNKSLNDTISYLSIPTGCSFIGFQKEGRMKVKINDFLYNTEKYYVNAQTTVPYQMCSSDHHLNVLVACLKPTAIYHLFQMDASKIVNTGVNPKHLFKADFAHFSDAFEKKNTVEERMDLINSIFIRQLDCVTPAFNFIDTAIDLILKKEGKVRVEELIHKLNVSKRYFQKKFKKMVGIPPLLYIKIIRYNFVFSSFKEKGTHYNASSASLYFYDSAHYSKSFKDYMGMSPSEFDTAQYPFIKLSAIDQAIWVNSFRALSI
jgi:AraC-like DNA-binding protein